jgi:uncharacterized alkaline shock family protein YloU
MKDTRIGGFEMKEEYNINDAGDIKISDDVVASIAGLATSEVEGVTSIAGHITSEIVGKFGVKNLSKGIKLSIDNGTVSIDLYINIRYGYSIPKITAQIRDKVKSAIESMTGLKTSDITIHIVDIEVK